ncbi:MAG: DNA mismatch repair endonuclease MutL [Candidatus Helarchaeota archaeon]
MSNKAIIEPDIRVLDESLIKKIAAGEVIERPASVVKELIENSIDAYASKIDIIIQEGGLKEITVIDNGHGMSRRNAELAFERHSTSKIKNTDDLFRINSFGFRGEALASIAAVSRVELKTRTKNSEIGTLVIIEGGKKLKIDEIGCAVGTEISVKNLFFNVPVRKKYLKSASTEFGHITEIVSLMAFANPEISFRLVHNSHEILILPGTGKLLENIARRYGNNVAKNMVEINYKNDWIQITGYTSNLQEFRASKYYITIIVNKRVIKNQTITNAILDAYRTRLMKNKYPITILNITIDPQLVDVNVHPTKKEVRFQNENQLYDIVQEAIENTLNKIKEIKKVRFEKQESLQAIEPIDGIKKEVKKEVKRTTYSKKSSSEQMTLFDKLDAIAKKESVLEHKFIETKKLPPMRYVGQIFDTYLVAYNDQNFYLIDQHAAHERIRFDKILQSSETSPKKVQKLISPIKVELIPDKSIDLNKILSILRDFGFDITHFGGTTYLINKVPVIIKKVLDINQIKDLIDEILHIKGKLSLKDIKIEIAQLIACKGAIKANTPLSAAIAKKILDDLGNCNNPFSCCHGRPTIISFSKNDVEKKFKRNK